MSHVICVLDADWLRACLGCQRPRFKMADVRVNFERKHASMSNSGDCSSLPIKKKSPFTQEKRARKARAKLMNEKQWKKADCSELGSVSDAGSSEVRSTVKVSVCGAAHVEHSDFAKREAVPKSRSQRKIDLLRWQLGPTNIEAED